MSYLSRLLFLGLAMASTIPVFAQIEWGFRGGVPLTEVTEVVGGSGNILNRSSRWAFGPMVELDLPVGLGVEVNALYRRVGYESAAASQTKGIWDFPVIAKYKFPGVLVRPYVGAGWTYRKLNSLLQVTSGPKNSNGFVLSTGVRFGVLLAKISPELRYTHFSSDGLPQNFRIKQNQVEALVGITF